MERLKQILEASVKNGRFSGGQMSRSIYPILNDADQTRHHLSSIRTRLSEKNHLYTITALLRSVFLIELVNDEVSSTKMETRWTKKQAQGKKQESFDDSDPRFCTFDGCVNALVRLLGELDQAVTKKDNRELLGLYQKYSVIPYELPLDYEEESRTRNSIDLKWIMDAKEQRALVMRERLCNPVRNNMSALFSSILNDKIKVKCYLTDRVQTGEHKTDREKRWEVHPESVHFALRRDCLGVESTLMDQMCHFQDFPPSIFKLLLDEELVSGEAEVYKDPVTLDPISFAGLRDEVLSPTHGKSDFHVGHLNPLKLVTDDPTSGHTPNNIGWFSADGNRIQGSLSLAETIKMLRRINDNYVKAGR